MGVTVDVHKWEEDFDVPASEFWKQLGDLIMGTPEEFRHLLRLELDMPYSDYGDGYLSVYYERPETEEEKAKREKHERGTRAYQEEQERQLLAILKAKYEPNS